MFDSASFPRTRMRRMRRDDFSRRLMREHALTAADLILPVFVLDGVSRVEDVVSMPGVQRLSLDHLFGVAEECLALGIPAMALFPVIEPALKSLDAAEAYNPGGLVPRVVAALKQRFPELGVITDIALDPVHHVMARMVVIDRSGYVLNDETVAVLEKQAAGHAHAAGVDVVAPSDMMDGRIRCDPRCSGSSENSSIPGFMAYSAKYASGFLRTVSRCRRFGKTARAKTTSATTRWIRPTATKRFA
jgi:porphobilinogen synthase